MKCVFLGLTTLDILNYLKKFPGSNEKVRADTQLFFAGGPAANAGVACAALGTEAVLVTRLGRQQIAELARQDLLAHGVEVIDLAFGSGDMPVVSSIIVDESSGDRCVVYTRPDSNHLLARLDYKQLLSGADLVMLDGHFPEPALDCVRQAKALGLKTVLDGGSWKDGLGEILPYIDYAICSGDFYPPGCTDSSAVVTYLQNYEVAHIAITGGSSSIKIWQPTCQEVPVEQTKVVDTLGAGDILHGAFCHYLVEGDFYQALERASRVATLSCKYRGTRGWIEDYLG